MRIGRVYPRVAHVLTWLVPADPGLWVSNAVGVCVSDACTPGWRSALAELVSADPGLWVFNAVGVCVSDACNQGGACTRGARDC